MPRAKAKPETPPPTEPLSDVEEVDEEEKNEEKSDEEADVEEQPSENEQSTEDEDEKTEIESPPIKNKPASRKSKDIKVVIENDEIEDEPEAIPERLGGESDADEIIPDSESDADDETEYKRELAEGEISDNDSEEEIENEENDQPEEDEILETIVAEDDEIEENDDGAGDDAPDEIFEGDEDGGEEVKKRKTASRSKIIKRRLFPFIQAKRKAVQSEMRDPPLFYANNLRVRQEAVEYLQKTCKLDPEMAAKLEKAIATATARIFKNDGVQPVVQSIIFKEQYIEILRYVIGAFSSLQLQEIIDELKIDNYGYKSKLYVAEHAIDKDAEDKIRNPDDVSDDPNYPCPKCKGTKHTRLLIQDRSGDEGMSLTLWCENKTCGRKWKIRG
jgi:DNA-directed RNA polymerase subunit M/transcription elongation factor TFIIS